MKILKSIALGTLLLSASVSVYATVIDFQQLEHQDANNISHGNLYTEDGFQINGQDLRSFGTLESRYTGSTALFSDVVNGISQLSRVDNIVFDLISIDLAELNGNQSPTAVVTFTRDGGHSQAFTLDGSAFGAQTFIFDVGFLGTSTVSWSQQSPFHQYDNIVLDETTDVPAPAALWLLGLGLISMTKPRFRRGRIG